MAARTRHARKSSARSGTSSSARRKSARSRSSSATRDSYVPKVAAQPSEELHAIYVVGLKNAHAVEKEALQVMQRQVERIKNYPDFSKKLREHIEQTEEQVERLEKILAAHDESASSFKDIVSQMMGNTAAVAHAAAGDEILKNAFANQALEAYEIATYKSLIVMAMRQGDQKALPLLRRSLGEEERMAKWVDTNVGKLTLAYLEREEKGRKADR